jgi:hypothetical protein
MFKGYFHAHRDHALKFSTLGAVIEFGFGGVQQIWSLFA